MDVGVWWELWNVGEVENLEDWDAQKRIEVLMNLEGGVRGGMIWRSIRRSLVCYCAIGFVDVVWSSIGNRKALVELGCHHFSLQQHHLLASALC
jgi:hypothetical protein